MAGGELGLGDEAVAHQQPLQRRDPDRVVARGEVLGRRQALARVPRCRRCSSGPSAPAASVQRERPPLPVGVEHRLVGLGRDRPEAHLPAEVLRPVHGAHGASGSPVPIIESRVTSAASAASSSPRCPRAASAPPGSAARRWNPRPGSPCRDERHAELGQHAARVDHRARAVGRRLVPDRRQAEHRPRVAGAERADDQVVLVGRVLDRHHVLALPPAVAELGDGRGGVRAQPVGEGRIDPGPRDHPGAVARPDLASRRSRRCASSAAGST